MGPQHSLSKNQLSGFSLLELIIVLVIIGVIVAAITLSITDTRGDILHFEARRLAARLSVAIDEAILTNQEYGLDVESDSYRFLVLQDDRWQAINTEGERQLIQQKLPEGMEIQLKVGGLFSHFQQQGNSNKLFKAVEEGANNGAEINNEGNDTDKALRPQIYLMSSGELNPFSLLIGYDDDIPVFYRLQGSFDGSLSLEGPIQDSMRYQLGLNDD